MYIERVIGPCNYSQSILAVTRYTPKSISKYVTWDKVLVLCSEPNMWLQQFKLHNSGNHRPQSFLLKSVSVDSDTREVCTAKTVRNFASNSLNFSSPSLYIGIALKRDLFVVSVDNRNSEQKNISMYIWACEC